MKRNALLISALMAIVLTAEPMLLTLSARENSTRFVVQTDYTAPEMCENTQATSNSQPQSTSISHSEIRNLKLMKLTKILHMHDFKTNNAPATLVFTGSIDCDKPRVMNVYCVDWMYIESQQRAKYESDPALVRRLVYHDLGTGKEFCGIITQFSFFDKYGEPRTLEREIRLDDTTAQLMIDFMAGDTEWGNNTGIKFYETKSDQLAPVKVFDY